MTLRIEPVSGAALRRALPALAKLRIEVFREWPYLYEGSLEYEANYIERFARLALGVIVVATDAGDEAIGAATAPPMEGQNPDVTAPFVERGYDLKKLFYFGEFLVLQAGLSWARHRACLLRSARRRGSRHARRRARDLLGRRALAPDDPRRDPNHRPLDGFWQKRGYAPVEGLVGHYAWTDIGDKEQTRKPMQFWMREL